MSTRPGREPPRRSSGAATPREAAAPPIRWLAGEPAVQEALARAWLAPAAAGAERTLLRDRPERRRLLRFRWPDGPDLFVKQFRMGGRRRRLRRRLMQGLHLEAARREWWSLVRLAGVGVPVPTPRALGILPGGDRILAVDYLPGQALDAALREPAADPRAGQVDRRALAVALGSLVRALHAQGLVHRDLHGGNVFLGEKGPVLLDFQLARPGRGRRARLRDIGQLEASLEAHLSLAQRVRLRAAALGLSPPFDAEARRLLRESWAAAGERQRAQAASRSRRALRPGRRFATAADRRSRGLRVQELDPELLAEALAAEREGRGETLAGDGPSRVTAVAIGAQRWVLKRSEATGIGAALADRLRGSPARRAWRAGFALEAHGIDAVRPLAFLEERRLGLPRSSLLVMEDLRPARPAPELAGGRGAELVDALARLAERLHGRGILHRDLCADRVWLRPDAEDLEPRLSGLEHVRLRARLSDEERRRGLARLNATLPDAADGAARCRAFARYAWLQPFAGGRERALRAIARASLAEGSRWSGAGCREAAGLSPSPRP